MHESARKPHHRGRRSLRRHEWWGQRLSATRMPAGSASASGRRNQRCRRRRVLGLLRGALLLEGPRLLLSIFFVSGLVGHWIRTFSCLRLHESPPGAVVPVRSTRVDSDAVGPGSGSQGIDVDTQGMQQRGVSRRIDERGAVTVWGTGRWRSLDPAGAERVGRGAAHLSRSGVIARPGMWASRSYT
jgi:hypothetical protein